MGKKKVQAVTSESKSASKPIVASKVRAKSVAQAAQEFADKKPATLDKVLVDSRNMVALMIDLAPIALADYMASIQQEGIEWRNGTRCTKQVCACAVEDAIKEVYGDSTDKHRHGAVLVALSQHIKSNGDSEAGCTTLAGATNEMTRGYYDICAKVAKRKKESPNESRLRLTTGDYAQAYASALPLAHKAIKACIASKHISAPAK